ncbi:MAG TPA: hypothetical protein DCZ84_01460 [Candidatus Vogelbacteria bacterium]|nr:MAG: hypothetical protein UY66_C0013G0003 [Parcubacteria group bacterium GW2011_GWC1_51_35]KKW33975.1 MAG: hypothetical protein UY80_C0027G0002 [Parcubacteria group bacterium GW2011_GWB1_53_43]HBB65289.1 hypothetical protein [Candidatus Vogelbacteria bacterium]HBC44467.1 hypothetical protein [Candidatus Vogelbacteria bacterium]HCQ91891.1 hypothetical protein [Candidatus Vogelbacteria bacterium]
MVHFDEEKQDARIKELRAKEEEDFAEIIAAKVGLPYMDLSKIAINTDALGIIHETDARKASLACFRATGKLLDIAVASPESPEVKAIIDDFAGKGFSTTLYVASKASLERAWGHYADIAASSQTHAGVIAISDEDIVKYLDSFTTLAEIKQAITDEEASVRSGKGISRLVEIMLAGALALSSSDIHLEPRESSVRIRYRLDGVLADAAELSAKTSHPLLMRLKLVSAMKLNVTSAAQDGRFSIKIKGSPIEIRSSVIPGAYGESVVMRILNPETIALTLEKLGVEEELQKIFEAELAKPNGMILLTGPTGSGKTTTLYAFLRRVSNTGNKIITIEDPIEYHMEGINQTQIEEGKGYTFLEGLRSALRQDPDIIMVGEIRDKETAEVAVNAALTGHLVFSTLHTNNAAGTIPRLIDLGVNPKVLGSALTISIAQRLVRTLCSECRQEAIISGDEAELIKKVLAQIHERRPELALPPANRYYKPGSCASCGETGYRGRVGIFEALMVDAAITEATVKNPSEREITVAALPQHILSMREDGIIKVLRGETSIEELGRVIDLHAEFV